MSMSTKIATLWFPPTSLPEKERPKGFWEWLIDPSPLTPKLRTHAGDDLKLEVLQMTTGTPWTDEWSALEITPRSRVLRREILFSVHGQPWIYATTTVGEKEAALLPWFERLGSEPLGDQVFARHGGRRLWLEIGRLGYAVPLARQVRAQIHPECLPNPLWARRSLLQCGHARFLVHEIFLRGATPWQCN